MQNGEKVADMANDTSREADTDGITGLMYGCSVSALSRFWDAGEAFGLWHNLKTQIKEEGEHARQGGGFAVWRSSVEESSRCWAEGSSGPARAGQAEFEPR